MSVITKTRKVFCNGVGMLFSPRQSSQYRINAILSKDNAKALQDDWYIVGDDIQIAMENYIEKYGR